MVAESASFVGFQRRRPGRRGHDVDGGRGWGGGVVVVGGRGGDGGRGDGGRVVVAQLLPQTILHVLVGQRRRVADLILQDA